MSAKNMLYYGSSVATLLFGERSSSVCLFGAQCADLVSSRDDGGCRPEPRMPWRKCWCSDVVLSVCRNAWLIPLLYQTCRENST
jgi:hypothetical protein